MKRNHQLEELHRVVEPKRFSILYSINLGHQLQTNSKLVLHSLLLLKICIIFLWTLSHIGLARSDAVDIAVKWAMCLPSPSLWPKKLFYFLYSQKLICSLEQTVSNHGQRPTASTGHVRLHTPSRNPYDRSHPFMSLIYVIPESPHSALKNNNSSINFVIY